MNRKHIASLAAVGAIALIAAGCGGGGSSSKSASSGSGSGQASSSAAKVSVTKSSSLGTIVVDGSGRTLYLFAKDTGNRSTCSGACAANWPPFTAGHKPALGNGLSASAISLAKRADGKKQVIYAGHPLYYFSGDQSAGQVNGQGVNEFGAKWFAVTPGGSKASGSASSSGSSSSPAPYGY
jgi:predicted lipoprotein with Yx(FWY)xxD motif